MNGNDRVIPAALFRDLRAFLNAIMASCAECMRPRQMCEDCDLRASRGLLSRLDATRDFTGATNADRMEKALSVRRCAHVCAILLAAGRPILAREIDMEGLGNSSNRKHTLRALWRRKVVLIDTDPLGKNIYSIVPGKEQIARDIARYGK